MTLNLGYVKKGDWVHVWSVSRGYECYQATKSSVQFAPEDTTFAVVAGLVVVDLPKPLELPITRSLVE